PEISYSQIPKIEHRFDSQFCPNCGMKIKTNISNCPNCGTDLGEEKRFQCPICRSSKIETSVKCPICGTRFHRRCFLEWVKIKGTCPVCKNKVDESIL
ncbi:MAG: hypothetical protein EU548_03910, partial [Promethearchaeota archaeon]